MNKKINISLAVLFILITFYYCGPKPSAPIISNVLPEVTPNLSDLSNYISEKENQRKIKPGNEARIVWADSTPTKTKYTVLYLHGFGACSYEGQPINIDFAKKYHCNLVLSRLAFQGIDTSNAMYYLTAENLWNSALEAYAIAKETGDSIIIMGTSTGCTLGLMLAARYPEIKGLINMSPNIRLHDPLSFMLNNPWGLQIAKLVVGGDSFNYQSDAEFGKYWYLSYRLESVTELENLLESQMTEETFAKVDKPCINLYYYKDEEHQDQMVDVNKTKWMHEKLATNAELKRIINVDDAGDHIIGNPIRSKNVTKVYSEICSFSEQVMGLKPYTLQ
jgi:pimeloyl-ACP methyl ester carboxylesterase